MRGKVGLCVCFKKIEDKPIGIPVQYNDDSLSCDSKGFMQVRNETIHLYESRNRECYNFTMPGIKIITESFAFCLSQGH